MTAWRRREVIGNATLYLGDCLEILPTLPHQVDAVITDPPYGIDWKPRVNHQDQPWQDVAVDLAPVLHVGRYHLLWGGQYFANTLPIHEGWLTWIKRPLDSDFSGDGRSYATVEMAWRDWGKARHIAHVWDGGKREGAPENRTFCHPAQKPVEVMRWCVGQLPADARTVLDPFMGSGTTGIACAQLGRAFVGIELEESYFEIACERIENAQRQERLFA